MDGLSIPPPVLAFMAGGEFHGGRRRMVCCRFAKIPPTAEQD